MSLRPRRFSVKKALLPRLCSSLLACAAFGLVPQSSRADTWPARTVHVVIPFSPGMGSPDAAARMLADGPGKRWKQAVVVENRPGADTMLATRAFLEMHDGHSLLPMALREQIASDVRYILRDPDVQERLTTAGLIARGTTPPEFERVITRRSCFARRAMLTLCTDRAGEF